MPVHEIRYRAWEGALLPPWQRLLAIPRFTLLAVWNKWLSMAIFTGAIQTFAYTGYLMLVTNEVIRSMLNMNLAAMSVITPTRIFQNFYIVQYLICMVTAVAAAPRMISPERQHNALPLIYSRPITRGGYIAGKTAGIALMMSYLTWFQVTLIFILMMAFYPQTHEFWTQFGSVSLPLFLKSFFIGWLITIALSLYSLACSAATKNHLYAAVLFFVILFAASFITVFVQEELYTGFPDLGLYDLVKTLSLDWLAAERPATFSLIKTLLGFAVWIGLSYAFMRWRLRPVDVYSE